jgi:hypothetical protein
MSNRSNLRQEESKLLQYLMLSYDREVRPVINVSTAMKVKVGITLTQIFDMVSYSVSHHQAIVLCPYIVNTNPTDLLGVGGNRPKGRSAAEIRGWFLRPEGVR